MTGAAVLLIAQGVTMLAVSRSLYQRALTLDAQNIAILIGRAGAVCALGGTGLLMLVRA